MADSAPPLPRPRYGRSLLPAEPDGPSRAGRHRTTPAHRPPSVVTTSRSSPWSAITPATRPERTCRGTCEHRLPPLLPHQPAGTWRWTSPHGSTRRRARRRSLHACQAAAQVCRRHSCEPRTANTRPSLPRQTRLGQRRPSHSPTTTTPPTPCANVACPAAPTPSGSSAARTARLPRPRTPDACPSGHPDHPGRVDTARPGHRTSARPVGRTSVRMVDRGRGQHDERRGRRPDILDGHDDGDRRLRGPNLARAAASAVLGNPCRLRAVTTPAAAATGQLRSTAPAGSRALAHCSPRTMSGRE
jgi:hypothetical protein